MQHEVTVLSLDELQANRDPGLELVLLGYDIAFLVQRDSDEIVVGTERFWVHWQHLACIVSFVRGRGEAARVIHVYRPLGLDTRNLKPPSHTRVRKINRHPLRHRLDARNSV
jgi:hypothetical protein